MKRHLLPARYSARLAAPILMVATLAAAPVTLSAAGESVDVWVTRGDQSLLLTQQSPVSFGADTTQGLLIHVNERHAYQTIEGFGAALSDSSAWLLTNAMSAVQRGSLMESLFGTGGVRLSWLRLPMGASDFALSHYSYDDMPAGQTDPDLQNFSIDHDRAYVIPILQQALAVNPDLEILASPWSPPGWMKTSDSLIGGELLAQYQQAYADYFVRFVQEYAAEGIVIDSVTPQNEPHNVPADYPGMLMEVEQQIEFVANYLGPALNALGTRILTWDHNWNEPFYGIEVLADVGAGPYAEGTAFHCYGGNVAYQSLTHRLEPGGSIFISECTSGAWSTNWGNNLLWDANTLIVGGVRNWASGILKWNLALDESFGPHLGGCSDCTGVVTIDSGTGDVTYNHDYYALGHASKFVDPGAVRVASDSLESSKIQTAAFKNPDGTKVLIATNDNNRNRTVKVRWGGQSFQYSLPKKSVTTFEWNGTQAETSTPDVPAGLTAQGDHDSVRLAWTFSHLAASYTVERAPAGGSFAAIASGVTTPSYVDVSGVAGTAYDYRVKAVNAAGTSAASAPAGATPGPLDAFSTIEAEDFASQHGVGVEDTSDAGGGLNVAFTDDGDYLAFPAVDFGDGLSEVQLRLATESSGGTVELRLDAPGGPLLGSVPVSSTGGWQTWQTLSAAALGTSGVQALYVVFQGGSGIGNLNWLTFTPCSGCGDPPGGGAMHVGDVAMSSVQQGPSYKAKADVLIVDQGGSPVANATVSGSYTGASSSSPQKATNTSGHAIMDSTKVRGGGTWTFCVDDVTLAGWTYDSAANVETCDSVTAP